MNYRNLTMDEMVNRLADEADADTFIEMSKAFIQKFADGDYISKSRVEADLEYAKDTGMDKGYAEAKEVCRDEMVEYIESTFGQMRGLEPQTLFEALLNGPLYAGLLKAARTIG